MRKLIRRETGMAPDEVIDPVSPRFDVPPEPVTTRPEPGYALALMGVTGIGALGLYGLVPAIAAVVYAAGLAVHVWGWYGGDPERPSEIWAPG